MSKESNMKKIQAWDTEEASCVSGTTDPRKAARAWNRFMAESFFEDQTEYYSNLTTPGRVSRHWSLGWVRPEALNDEAPMSPWFEHPDRSDLVPVWTADHGGDAFLPMGENA